MIVEHPTHLFWKKVLAHGFLIIFLVIIMFPFFMVLSISFREGNFSVGSLIPENPTLEHWALALGMDYTRADGTVVSPPYPVLLWMWNSVKIALFTSSGVLAISTISAYAFSRIKFYGRNGLLDAFFILQMFPNVLYLIALYAIFDGLGDVSPLIGLDSQLSLILVYLSGILMHVWTIKGYFDGVDKALNNAASIDGASPWQTFRYIFLPLAIPIMAVVFVLVFIGVINDYPVASVLLRSQENLTLAVGSSYYLNDKAYRWGDFSAAAILAGVPITIVFLIAQKYLVSGLSDGSVKG
ncbi:MAG: maltose ABC transporter permease MalG [Gammaproteobacteria bacterium]|nr:maltose ABC transporter permease MalG [Gammaproteobacteria bacterium]